jgi:ubiquinol oxidase
MVRADEAHHRDVNHALASRLSGQPTDPAPVAPYPEHADSAR